jgi:thioredoxin reductase
MSPDVMEKVRKRGIGIDEGKIVRHIGKGTDLLGLEMEDGRELFFDGFLVDEGLVPNTAFLEGWDYRKDQDGLILVDEDRQLRDASGKKIPGLFAAGDIVSGERKLIATAFALGQDAGLAASDTLREWD